MAETPSSAVLIPIKHLEEEHLPVNPSPLNPDAAASRTRTREQREKKATLKKRELVDGDIQGPGKKPKTLPKDESYLSPTRYKLPAPKPTDFDSPKAPTLTPSLIKAGKQFYESSEHVYNRKGFRYTRCIVDPAFPKSQYHRSSETEPFGPRFDYEDSSSLITFDLAGKSISTEKGFRMSRANVGAREGRHFWECKILSGVKPDPIEGEAGGHVRVGFARREAQLDAPVGFDAYSYGLRDVAGQTVHMSRPKDFANSNFVEGDVIGLEITLPSLSLHRKVADGVYNKAVDVSDDLDPSASNEFLDIIRDRVPIRYKNSLYFEQFEYSPTKELEELMNPSPVLSTNTATATDPPNPNHPQPALRTLPFSSIKVYKNGELLGTPFADLLAFLPPASKPLNQAGAREGLDDGMLGYFPAVSVFRGGAAETNFGPNFWYPPPEFSTSEDIEMADALDPTMNPTTRKPIAGQHSRLRAMNERFDEQIAEDVTFDLIDEIDFWWQDGKEEEGPMRGLGDQRLAALGPVDPNAPEVAVAEIGDMGGDIKEIIQEDA